jgi:hypothetical protein
MMDKAQKPSNAECYTPSSEPFRIYKNGTSADIKGFGLKHISLLNERGFRYLNKPHASERTELDAP